MNNLWRNVIWHMWKDITHYLTFLSRQSFSCILQMDVTLLQGKEESIKISLQVFTTIKTRKYFYLFLNNLLRVLIIFCKRIFYHQDARVSKPQYNFSFNHYQITMIKLIRYMKGFVLISSHPARWMSLYIL